MKKNWHYALAAGLFFSTCFLSACNKNPNLTAKNDNVLRVASWDEYIDEGGSFYQDDDPDIAAFKDWFYALTGKDLSNSKALYEEFEDWYKATYGKNITVEYVALQDNETMYNKIKMGNRYDILCPSEYMIMKLVSEDMLQKLPDSFYDKNNPNNYYAKYLSPYINGVFTNGKLTDNNPWSTYTAGYMWGSTGFVFNPEKIGSSPEEARTIMSSWSALSSPACTRKITSKDNVRDAYFTGLGMYYEEELLALKAQYEREEISLAEYQSILSTKMNDTSSTVMNGVKKKLEQARRNLYGLETDEGKNDVIAGRLAASYQWSGDAVFIIDEAEGNENNPLYLEYSIPKAASNLWFDGWVMMKNANVEAATAFMNFLSMPENVIRNMYYIGYTSCIANEDIFAYIEEAYGAGEEETDTVDYNLSYFFGEDYILTTTPDQTRRQLFAQYPDQDTINRLVVMKYFDKATNERANRMWNNIK